MIGSQPWVSGSKEKWVRVFSAPTSRAKLWSTMKLIHGRGQQENQHTVDANIHWQMASATTHLSRKTQTMEMLHEAILPK